MKELEKIKIIFSDIDGTLLPFEGKDLAPTAALLEKLMKAGYIFVPCTGRGTGNIPGEILGLEGIRYVITANGAIVSEWPSRRVIYERKVPRSAGRKLTNYLRSFNGMTYSYRKGEHFLDVRPGQILPESDTPTLKEWLRTVIPLDFDLYLAQEESEKLDKFGFATFDPQVRLEVMEDIKKQPFYPEFFVTTSGFWNVEFNAAGANKGEAASWLARQLGFERDEMLSAGDNINDIPMLKAAGLSLVPENGEEEAKQAAGCIVADCRENGVENFLKQLL